ATAITADAVAVGHHTVGGVTSSGDDVGGQRGAPQRGGVRIESGGRSRRVGGRTARAEARRADKSRRHDVSLGTIEADTPDKVWRGELSPAWHTRRSDDAGLVVLHRH